MNLKQSLDRGTAIFQALKETCDPNNTTDQEQANAIAVLIVVTWSLVKNGCRGDLKKLDALIDPLTEEFRSEGLKFLQDPTKDL